MYILCVVVFLDIQNFFDYNQHYSIKYMYIVIEFDCQQII